MCLEWNECFVVVFEFASIGQFFVTWIEAPHPIRDRETLLARFSSVCDQGSALLAAAIFLISSSQNQ